MLFAPKTQTGQGLVEYALILLLVALLVLLVLTMFGKSLGTSYSNVIDSI